MNREQLEAIKARRAQATKGDWLSVPYTVNGEGEELSGYFITTHELLASIPEPLYVGKVAKESLMILAGQDPEDTANADFIANAPSDIDALVAEVEKLQSLLTESMNNYAKMRGQAELWKKAAWKNFISAIKNKE